MIYQLSHAGICVSDLNRAVRFYCDGLGFDLAERFELDSTMMHGLERTLEAGEPVSITSQFIQKDGTRIELLAYTSPGTVGAPSATRRQLGLTHLSFYVDDVDEAGKRLVEFGGQVLDDTRTSAGIEMLFLADPDGTRVELMAPRPS